MNDKYRLQLRTVWQEQEKKRQEKKLRRFLHSI